MIMLIISARNLSGKETDKSDKTLWCHCLHASTSQTVLQVAFGWRYADVQ